MSRTARHAVDALERSRKRHPSVRARRFLGRVVTETPDTPVSTHDDSASAISESGVLEGRIEDAREQYEEGGRGEDEEVVTTARQDGSRRTRPKRAAVAARAAGPARRRGRRTGESVLWEGRLSPGQRLRQWIPPQALALARKVRAIVDVRVWVGVSAVTVLLAVVVAGVGFRSRPREDVAEGLGLRFELTEQWQDRMSDPQWPALFVTASKIAALGGEPALVVTKGSTALALLSRPVATDTTAPEAAAQDAEDVGLVYSLSTDTRLRGRSQADLFGGAGSAFTAERWVSGEVYVEETVVAPLGDRVVYAVWTAPASVWEGERGEIQKILRSARPVQPS